MIRPMRLPVFAIPAAVRPPNTEAGPRSVAAVRMLRLSVTDKCNYRCTYCMPAAGVPWLPKDEVLSFEEINDVVRAAVDVHGVTRFKLTGGEPTVRHGLTDLVALLRRIPDVTELSLTTNGQLLSGLAGPLRESGLDRVTVSLDSLDEARFGRITRTGKLADVLRGLDRLDAVGFTGTKVNCVAMRGTNDDELAAFAGLTLGRAWTVRFIEYMPLGDAAVMHAVPGSRVADAEQGPAGGCGAQDRGADAFIGEPDVRRAIEAVHGPLLPVDRGTEPGVGPATVYRLARGVGRVGFISAMSAPLCSTCNRLRLTADGVLRSCLFDGGEVPVRDLMRRLPDPAARRAAVAAAMVDCVRLKPDVHSGHGGQQMSRIGG